MTSPSDNEDLYAAIVLGTRRSPGVGSVAANEVVLNVFYK